jgi:hypothetical protein
MISQIVKRVEIYDRLLAGIDSFQFSSITGLIIKETTVL